MKTNILKAWESRIKCVETVINNVDLMLPLLKKKLITEQTKRTHTHHQRYFKGQKQTTPAYTPLLK